MKEIVKTNAVGSKLLKLLFQLAFQAQVTYTSSIHKLESQQKNFMQQKNFVDTAE